MNNSINPSINRTDTERQKDRKRERESNKIELKQKLIPLLVRNLKQHVADTIVNGNADIFTISTELGNISKKVQESISEEFARFGLDILDFYIEALDVDEKDEEYKKIKSSLGDAASLKLRASAARDSGNFYQTESLLIVDLYLTFYFTFQICWSVSI